MANNNGVVTTGFSNIHVATYASEGGVVSYTGVRKLGRSVSMSIDVSTSDDNDFYADDQLAETVAAEPLPAAPAPVKSTASPPEEEAFCDGPQGRQQRHHRCGRGDVSV